MKKFEIIDHKKTANEAVMSLLSQLTLGNPSVLEVCTQSLLKEEGKKNLKEYVVDIIKHIQEAKSYKECLKHFRSLPKNIVDNIGFISDTDQEICVDLNSAHIRTLKEALIKEISEQFNNILNKDIKNYKSKIEETHQTIGVLNSDLKKQKELLSQCEEKDKFRYKVRRNIALPGIIEISCNNFKISNFYECIQSIAEDDKEVVYSEIRIYAMGDIIFDSNLKLPGINLLLMAKKLIPLKNVVIDTSGKDGVNQWVTKRANNGIDKRILSDKPCGKDGEDGLNGAPGESAGHIYINAEIENKDMFIFRLNGGRGADGQSGGHGDHGISGNKGEDGLAENRSSIFTCDKSFKEGEPGERGGVGGNGGLAGLGGLGGHKGILSLVGYDQDKSELHIESYSGKDADDGECGLGGEGGKDGSDGLDHAMTWCGAFFLFSRRFNEERGKLRIEEIPHWWYGRKYQIHVLKNKEQIENECKVYSDGQCGDELEIKKERNKAITKNMTWNNQDFLSNDSLSQEKQSLISKISNLQNSIRAEEDKIIELKSSLLATEKDISEVQLIIEKALISVEKVSTSEKSTSKSLSNKNSTKYREIFGVIGVNKDIYDGGENSIERKKYDLIASCSKIISNDIAVKLESTLETLHNCFGDEIDTFISMFSKEIKQYQGETEVNKYSLAYIIGSIADDAVTLSNIEESRISKYEIIFSKMPIEFVGKSLCEKLSALYFSKLSWKELEEIYIYISNFCSDGNIKKDEVKIYKLIQKVIVDKIHLFSCNYFDHSNLTGYLSGIDNEKARISIHNLLAKGWCIKDELEKHDVCMSVLEFYKTFLESFKFNLQTVRKELDLGFYLNLVEYSSKKIGNQYSLNTVDDVLNVLELIEDDKTIALLCVVISYCDLTEEEISRLRNIALSRKNNMELVKLASKYNDKIVSNEKNVLLIQPTQQLKQISEYQQAFLSEYLEKLSFLCSISNENKKELEMIFDELFNFANATDQFLLLKKNMKYILGKLGSFDFSGSSQKSPAYVAKVLAVMLSVGNFESTFSIITGCQYRNWVNRLRLFEIQNTCDDLDICLEETNTKLQKIKDRGPILELLATKLRIEQDIIDVNYRITKEQFDTLLDYLGNSEIAEEKLELLSGISLHLWVKELKKVESHESSIIENKLRVNRDKSLEWTLNEIIELLGEDKNNSAIAKILTEVKKKAKKINKKLEKIKPWKKDQLIAWIKALKKNSRWLTEKREMVIAVLCKAINLSGMIGDNYPKSTQLTALLLLLSNNQDNHGWFAQVETGEGKTVIVAMFAALKCYMGGDVDVISSSKILAVENASQTAEFYRLMGISVSNNCDDQVEKNPELLKKRYEKNVVYGDIGSFQRDYLNTEYYKKNIIDKRKCSAVIVDEVDSMLLDKSENVLYLSHEIPDLRHLRSVFVKIWYEVCNSLDGELSEDENRSAIAHEVRACIQCGIISLPNYIKPLVEKKLTEWIENAYHASHMEVNHDYMIKDRSDRQPGSSIVIIDKNTGVEQPQMTWSNGLHQFLELKHVDKISNESLKAVFVSNLAFFKRFSGKIYGLSGTLGSDVEKDLLSTLYKVQTFNVPRSKEREYFEEKHIVEISKSKWYEAIITDIENKTKDGRAVLVICENIEDVNEIKKLLKSKTIEDRPIYTYTNSKDDLKFVSKGDCVSSGDIILATNIAGRGTDLRTDSVLEEKGGLSVILTYLPTSIRVQDQAFGRTARNGNKGSGKFIIYNEQGITDLEYLIKIRNQIEMMRMEDIRARRIQSIETEDDLFKSLMMFYDERKEPLKKTCKFLTKKIHIDHYVSMQLKSLLDEWAFWLDEFSTKITNVTTNTLPEIKKEFEIFKEKIKKTLEDDGFLKLIRSPHEVLSLGIYFMQQEEYLLADQCFDEIIKSEPLFCGISHYYKGLNIFYGSPSKDKNSVETRKKIVNELKSARNILRKRLQELHQTEVTFGYTQQAIRKQGHGAEANAFSESVMNEYQMISIHLYSIDNIIGTDIDITMFKDLDEDFKEGKFTEFYKKLTSNSDYVKPYRVSKKLEIHDEGDFIHQQLFYCKKEILQLLETKSKSEKGVDRKITFEEIKNIIGSKEEFLRIADKESIRFSCRYKINLQGFSLTKELLAEALGNLENTVNIREITTILKEHNGQTFDERLISNPLVRTRLRSFLRANNLVDIEEDTKVTLAFDINNKIIQIPSKLSQYAEFIVKLCKERGYKNQSGQVEIDINTKDLSLPDDAIMITKKLWDSLIDQRLIKPCKVKYDLMNSSSKDAIESKLNELKENIREDIVQICGDEAEQYCETVFDVLKKAIGNIKTMPSFKLSLDDLEKYYKTGEFPPEIQDFKNILFGQVMQIEDNPSWWNPKAFAVAMIGVCSIIAAVVIQCIGTYLGQPSMITLPLFNGLLREGIGDIIYAIRSFKNQEFSWKDYLINKGISLAGSLIMGVTSSIGIYNTQGFAASEVSTLQTVTTVLVEGGKGVLVGFSNLLLDHFIAKLPKMLMAGLANSIKHSIETNNDITTKLEQIKANMIAIRALSNTSKDAEKIINTTLNKIYTSYKNSETQNKNKNLILACAAEIPNLLVSAAEGLQMRSEFLRWTFLLTIANYVIKGITVLDQFSQLCNMSIDHFTLFNSELTEIVSQLTKNTTVSQEQPQMSIKDDAFEKFISRTLCEEREKQANLLIEKFTREILQPKIQNLMGSGINFLSNSLVKQGLQFTRQSAMKNKVYMRIPIHRTPRTGVPARVQSNPVNQYSAESRDTLSRSRILPRASNDAVYYQSNEARFANRERLAQRRQVVNQSSVFYSQNNSSIHSVFALRVAKICMHSSASLFQEITNHKIEKIKRDMFLSEITTQKILLEKLKEQQLLKKDISLNEKINKVDSIIKNLEAMIAASDKAIDLMYKTIKSNLCNQLANLKNDVGGMQRLIKNNLKCMETLKNHANVNCEDLLNCIKDVLNSYPDLLSSDIKEQLESSVMKDIMYVASIEDQLDILQEVLRINQAEKKHLSFAM